MRLVRVVFFPLFLLIISVAALAQSSQEERVLLEMLLAKDAATVEAHLPEVVQDTMNELKPIDRAQFDAMIMSRKQICARATCTFPPDGHAALVVLYPGRQESDVIELSLRRRLSDGVDTFLDFEIKEHGNRTNTMQVWMNLERGVWRLTELHGPSFGDVVYDKGFVKRLVSTALTANESNAIGCMRTFNTALVTYASSYPEIGFAESIAALGGRGGNSSQAGLIDSRLASGEKSGYRFEYRRPSRYGYNVVARPIKFGETGTKSFFTDQSGVIRFTPEDRPPTASDPPLQ
jgi:hypothetical protein